MSLSTTQSATLNTIGRLPNGIDASVRATTDRERENGDDLDIFGDKKFDADTTNGIQPLRQAWWMKHLSLLAILQAACLAIGLMFQSLTDSKLSISFLSTFTWITCIQGAFSYLIFSRLYRHHQLQQQSISSCMNAQADALDRTRNAMILGLTKLAEIRDGDADGHLDRVGKLSARLAEVAREQSEFRTQISPQFIRLIRFSAALHDIGKVGIEDAILLKPGQLTKAERSRMECHTHISSKCLNQIEECLGDSNFLQMAHEIALFHHERWDGSGYPTGISGEEIPLSARIVAIADVYDALAARRPYKEAFDHKRCMEIITSDAGSHFDPRLVELFVTVQSEFASVSQATDVSVSRESQLAQTVSNEPLHVSNDVETQSESYDERLSSILANVDTCLPTTERH
jgi:HD-GYP domain-containing protein (c-di-GMP phosphodiesterase class II)